MEEKETSLTWNYRIFKYDDESLGLHETFYEGEKIIGYHEKPTIVGDSVDELLDVLDRMKHDIKRFETFILDYEHEITDVSGGNE